MSTRPTSPCGLCREVRVLCRSHVIPEFCYSSMYDDNGCAYNADPLYPDSSRKVQSGAWSFILCEDCENEVNEKYEKPFLKHWYKNKVLDLLAGSRGKIIGGLPYPEFKLFHLLNLFRASLSDHPMFDGFELKPAQMDRLRHMLRVVDPAENGDFRLSPPRYKELAARFGTL